MRIALISNNYTPYQGGVVSSINTQIAALQGQGHFVRLITLDFLGKAHDDPDYVIRIRTLAKFVCVQNHYAIPYLMRTQLYKLFDQYEFDLIHVHHPFLLGSIALEIAKKCSIPVVFTYHTLYKAYGHYLPLPLWMAEKIVDRLVQRFCQKADHVFIPGPSILEHVSYLIHCKHSCLASPVQDRFNQLPFSCHTTERNSQIHLLSVLRFRKEKNVFFLLDLIKILGQPYVLTLVGYGNLYNQLCNYAYNELGLSDQQVNIIVKPEFEKLIALYRRADLFVFPSKTDTQGLVLAEAMACSTPVIAVNGPGQHDIINQKQNGCIVNSLEEMAEIIGQYAASVAMQKKWQWAAWQSAKKYKMEIYTNQLLAVYADLLNH